MRHLTRWFNMIIKKRRELRRWQRIVTVLAAIITFATTYALILPAITIEREHTDEVAGMYLEQSADADAMLEENAMEPTDVDMTDTQESEENAPTYSDTAADGEEITAAPRVKTLKSAGKDYTVILTYDEKSGIPDDAVLYVSEIAQDSDEYKTYLEEAKKAMGLTEEETLPRCAARFFDIKIMVGDQEFTPKSGVSVEITYAEPLAENPETEVNAVHFADEAAEAEVIEASTGEVQDDGSATVEFTAESFSVYGVIYTVDFSWEVNGNLYDVKVTYSDDANIPADAVLKVTEFEEDSDEYTKARDAVLADKQAKGETIDTDDFGFSAMDISIVDKNGNKVEPSAELQVDITIKSLPGVEDLKAVEGNIAIQHHVESNDGVTVDEVFSKGTEEFPDLQMNIQEDPEIHASFPVTSFSTFSVTWSYAGYGYNSDRNVTVHYGYMDGDTFVEFEEEPSPIPVNGFNSTEAYLTYDFDGWQALNQVYYHQNETTNPTTGGTQIQNTLYKGAATGNWLYNPRYYGYQENNNMPAYSYYDRAGLINNALDNNSHIYVLYEQKPEVTQGGSPVPTNEGAEKPDDPSITKTSDVNHDGTNTIRLTVEGHTSPLKTDRMADVILIFDTSGSMGYRMDAEVDATGTEAPRMKATKDAAITLIETLLAENQGETGENAKFRIGLVPFSNRAHDTVTLTADEDALKTVIGGYEYQQPYYWGGYYPGGYTYTGLTPSGGTNWEEALQKANEMSVADDRSTFVIFITDGNPTFRLTRGEYTDAQLGTISTNNNDGQPTTDLSLLHAQYNVFGPGSGDWKENADAIEKGDRVSQTGSTGEGRNYAVALEQAKSIVEQNKNFYTLGIGPAVGRLKTLASDAGAPGNYYEATDVDGLNAEMNKIISQIKGELGYSNVSITDGITPLTQTVQKAGMSDDLPAEDDFVYEKYRAATQEDVEAGNAAAVGEMKWFSWNPEDEGAAPATYNTADGAVEWNLGEHFFLEEGVKYRCSFKVWPSQEAYDTIAKLNNGTLDYNSLDARTRAQIAGDNTTGYTLLTNMPNDPDAQAAIGSNVGAGFSYQEATKVGDVVSPVDETDVSDTFIPVSDLDLDKQRITVKKEWLNGLDGRTQVDSISLNVVAQDAPGSQPPFATVSVGSGNTPAWTNSVFISTGLLKVEDGETIIYEQGHDFILTEAEELAYYWELTADTYRPMVITDASKGYDVPTPVLLKKVASSSTDFDYEIDGGKYQIIPGGGDALKAVNYRRSNLNLTKRVVDKDGETDISDSVKDELFEFTVTVTDKAGKDIWFSVNAVANDESTKIMDLITSATAEVKDEVKTGFYYVASGTPFTVKMKPGWNLRVLNLPSGSTYTIVESDKEGYEYQGAVIDNGGTIDTETVNNGVTGTIDEPNTQYTITATNRLTASTILIKKTNLDGDQALNGATFKLYKKNAQDVYELFRDTFSVGTAGYSCVGLPAGEYKLEEQTPPTGYIITVKETFFSISDNESQVITLADGQTMASVSGTNDDELSVKNEPGAALPATGGPGTNLIYFLGIMLTGLAGAGLMMRKRRKML